MRYWIGTVAACGAWHLCVTGLVLLLHVEHGICALLDWYCCCMWSMAFVRYRLLSRCFLSSLFWSNLHK